MISQLRIPGLLAAAAVVVATGLLLTRVGRPYSTLVLSIHKLVALAAVIAVGVLTYRAVTALGLGGAKLVFVGLAALLVIATFVSGGVLSGMPTPPEWATGLHRIASWLTVVSVSVTAVFVAGPN